MIHSGTNGHLKHFEFLVMKVFCFYQKVQNCRRISYRVWCPCTVSRVLSTDFENMRCVFLLLDQYIKQKRIVLLFINSYLAHSFTEGSLFNWKSMLSFHTDFGVMSSNWDRVYQRWSILLKRVLVLVFFQSLVLVLDLSRPYLLELVLVLENFCSGLLVLVLELENFKVQLLDLVLVLEKFNLSLLELLLVLEK